MSEQRLIFLFQRQVMHTATRAEQEELSALVLDPQYDDMVRQLVQSSWENGGSEYDLTEADAKVMLDRILQRKEVVSMKRWLVAASIILLVGVGSYFVLFNNREEVAPPVATSNSNDVSAPENNRAVITLADGRKIYLDAAGPGQLAEQSNVQVIKSADGKIIYTGTSSEDSYNTLYNPKGSRVIDMQLADGSHVWLNAGSSVTYPVAFTGNERKVSINGEAYFEVTRNAKMPFIVTKSNIEISVLGTHFNVNAYDDESDIKVTLLEGSVDVNDVKLKPGQQAIITNQIKVINDVNMEAVMAWKNGLFQFEGAGIEAVMRQISRWYDVEVIYEAQPKEQHFRGEISRDVSVSKVFTMLEATGTVQFRVENKKVFVIK